MFRVVMGYMSAWHHHHRINLLCYYYILSFCRTVTECLDEDFSPPPRPFKHFGNQRRSYTNGDANDATVTASLTGEADRHPIRGNPGPRRTWAIKPRSSRRACLDEPVSYPLSYCQKTLPQDPASSTARVSPPSHGRHVAQGGMLLRR